jgi:hypothetical protein
MPYGKRSKKKPLMVKDDTCPRQPPPVEGNDKLEKLYARGIAELQGDNPPKPSRYGSSGYGRKSSGYGS